MSMEFQKNAKFDHFEKAFIHVHNAEVMPMRLHLPLSGKFSSFQEESIGNLYDCERFPHTVFAMGSQELTNRQLIGLKVT